MSYQESVLKLDVDALYADPDEFFGSRVYGVKSDLEIAVSLDECPDDYFGDLPKVPTLGITFCNFSSDSTQPNVGRLAAFIHGGAHIRLLISYLQAALDEAEREKRDGELEMMRLAKKTSRENS